MNKEWSELNKTMQLQLKKKDSFDNGIATLLLLLSKLMEQIFSFYKELTAEDFYAVLFKNANGYHSKTIAYSLWHIFRIEDIVINTLIADREQIFFEQGYQKRIGSPIITTGNEITNQFPELDAYMEANCTKLSRADFAGTWPTTTDDKTAASVGVELAMYDAASAVNPDDVMPTSGATNGLQLIDMRGLDYDDPQWELLLDQLTVEEIVAVLNDGAYNTAEIASIGKPATSDPDGPQGFTSLMGSTGNAAYCSEYLMAQTWNPELMYRMGEMIGEEALASGYNGWYAPAMNTHRSPFAGRNFEYYSEDGVLGGKLAAATVSGAASKGCYAYLKHFALNDQESYRTSHLCTWATEQAVREIYLKPFELAIKDSANELKYIADAEGTVATKTVSGCTAVMSSFNFVGNTWAGGHRGLCTGVLRDEWGFNGFVITDFNLYDYMNKNQAFYAGTDHHLTYSAWSGSIADTTSATAVLAMRQSIKNILYTVANSNAMNGVAPGTVFVYGLATWQIALYAVSALLMLFVVIKAIHCVIRVRKHKNN